MGAERRSSREDTERFEFGITGPRAVEPQDAQGQVYVVGGPIPSVYFQNIDRNLFLRIPTKS